jgi:hypothetical protein
MSATQASGPKSSTRERFAHKLIPTLAAGCSCQIEVQLVITKAYFVPAPGFGSNSTPIEIRKWSNKTGRISAGIAAERQKLTAVNAILVNSSIICLAPARRTLQCAASISSVMQETKHEI